MSLLSQKMLRKNSLKKEKKLVFGSDKFCYAARYFGLLRKKQNPKSLSTIYEISNTNLTDRQWYEKKLIEFSVTSSFISATELYVFRFRIIKSDDITMYIQRHGT